MVLGFNTSGISTDDARQENLVAGLIERYDKRLPGSGEASHQGRLSEVYRDAIELNGGSLVSASGWVTTMGLLGGVLGIWALPGPPYLLDLWEMIRTGRYFGLGLSIAGPFAIFFIGLYFEMFSPSEMPIYFDRLRRKVYYVHQGQRKRFLLFGPTTVEARTADWSLVDCELHAKMGGSTTSFRRTFHLLFLVRASATDPTIVDSFVLPSVEFPGAMWEYIRGYMEAGMPPLQAGEVPPTKGPQGIKGFDMVEALKQRRRDYWRDWKEFPWTQLWQHLVLPFFVVFLVVNRFVVWTAQTVTWPKEIEDALGAPITEADLAVDTRHTLRVAAAHPDPGHNEPAPRTDNAGNWR
ncbi:DUF6708 domain-containing protein [Variovorax ginsengisoli]|uniref:DUF6708 domain-containing protein n=1 Tax=Variovorax ginsengisoli TaxID=363844 RepID=A0ABT9SC13_9BURK|nr:DUF6708 domain-containing protein [Variovorax ginsengisoli]MDP9901886.1 hypothetical protein [Variovorax ginsengisoli]